MGTLASALGPHASRIAGQPRVYIDANVPAGLVAFMRSRLRWDVLYVIEDDDLRRASDREHFRRAKDLSRTLITLDRDYLDPRRFPPRESGGVLVIAAPDETRLRRLLRRVDVRLRRGAGAERELPLAGQTLEVAGDWT